MTKTANKTILFSDPSAEIAYKQQIETQQRNVQAAVQKYNETARVLHIPTLQPDQLRYFIPGGASWCLHQWKECQVLPKAFPANISRTKYIELLDQPNFAAVEAATTRCNMITDGLFVLDGDTVNVDPEIAARYVYQRTVYLEPSEEPRYSKLLNLVDLAYELGLIQHNSQNREVLPLNLSQTGLRHIPFSEGRVAYQFDAVDRLKAFLACGE